MDWAIHLSQAWRSPPTHPPLGLESPARPGFGLRPNPDENLPLCSCEYGEIYNGIILKEINISCSVWVGKLRKPSRHTYTYATDVLYFSWLLFTHYPTLTLATHSFYLFSFWFLSWLSLGRPILWFVLYRFDRNSILRKLSGPHCLRPSLSTVIVNEGVYTVRWCGSSASCSRSQVHFTALMTFQKRL